MTSDDIEQWLTSRIAAKLGVPPTAISRERPLDELGIDSVEALALAGELETFLGRRLEPTVLWDHGTIAALSLFLSGGAAAPSGGLTAGMSDAEVDALLRKLAGA